MLNTLNISRATSEVTKLSMRIGTKFFSIANHVLNFSVGTTSGGVVNIDSFQFDVERRQVVSIKADDI